MAVDEVEAAQLMSLDSRPSDIGQVCPSDPSPELETTSEAVPVSDPTDEIHEDHRRPSHLYEQVPKAAAPTISTPPAICSEKVQEDDISSLRADTPGSYNEDPVATVLDATPPPLVIPCPASPMPRTPRRSTPRTRSQSRSRSLSPTLPSSPLTCLSSSPIREEETRQSTPDSDLTDLETDCKPTKTSAKRRSMGEVDVRAFKKSRLETVSSDSAADGTAEEQPASKPRRNTGKKSARSSSPSPCSEPSPVSMDVTATPNPNDLESTDQDLMGMVVEALAMTRASSMDVEAIHKIVVVRLTVPVPDLPPLFFPLYDTIDFHTLSIGHSTIVEDGTL